MSNENKSKITKETVEHIANLARVGLSSEQCEQYANECGAIIKFVDQLNEVNTDGIEPMSHAGDYGTIWREDREQQSIEQAEKILKNAPQSENGFFVVPKIIG